MQRVFTESHMITGCKTGEPQEHHSLMVHDYRMHLNASRSSSFVSNPGCALLREKKKTNHPVPTAGRGRAGVQYTPALRFGLHAADICATFWLAEWIPNYTLE